MRLKDFTLYPLIRNYISEIKNECGYSIDFFCDIDFTLAEGTCNLLMYKVHSKYFGSRSFKQILGDTEVICKCRSCNREIIYGEFTEFISKVRKWGNKGLETNGFYCDKSCSTKFLGNMACHREQGRQCMLQGISEGKLGRNSKGYAEWEEKMINQFGPNFRSLFMENGTWGKAYFTDSSRRKIQATKLKWTNERKNEMYEKRKCTHFLNGTKLFGDGSKRYSLISKECFSRLQTEIEKVIDDFEGKYAEDEFIVNGKYLDFYDPNYNIWVEFNGSYYHADPKLYNETDIIHKSNGKSSAKEIWECDEKREMCISKKVKTSPIIIWEREYKKNKKKLIKSVAEKIIDIIRNERNINE